MSGLVRISIDEVWEVLQVKSLHKKNIMFVVDNENKVDELKEIFESKFNELKKEQNILYEHIDLYNEYGIYEQTYHIKAVNETNTEALVELHDGKKVWYDINEVDILNEKRFNRKSDMEAKLKENQKGVAIYDTLIPNAHYLSALTVGRVPENWCVIGVISKEDENLEEIFRMVRPQAYEVDL